MNTDTHGLLFLLVVFFVLFNSLKNGIKLIAKENRNHSRRRLMSAETVVIACAGNGNTEKIYGEIPVSRSKLSALFGIVGVAVAAVAAAVLGVLLCL